MLYQNFNTSWSQSYLTCYILYSTTTFFLFFLVVFNILSHLNTLSLEIPRNTSFCFWKVVMKSTLETFLTATLSLRPILSWSELNVGECNKYLMYTRQMAPATWKQVTCKNWKMTVKFGEVTLWYQFVLAKISQRLNIAQALFSIDLVENLQSLPFFSTFWRHNFIKISRILINFEPIITPVSRKFLLDFIMDPLRVCVHVWVCLLLRIHTEYKWCYAVA